MKRLFITTLIFTRVTKTPSQRTQQFKADTNTAEFTTCAKRNPSARVAAIASDPPNNLTFQQSQNLLKVRATLVGSAMPFVA
ncbi:hypothetical protein ACT3CD_05265 [Geofilum sp. OHC36d9]|uniref:hypothetical protein n=1 Tax=Geofilum sp. OHC36d9 TaxID=3458413 RepID=UPI004033610E